jgi:hypothetical protein
MNQVFFECIAYDFRKRSGNSSFRVAKQSNSGNDIRVSLAKGAWASSGDKTDTGIAPIIGAAPKSAYTHEDRTFVFGFWMVQGNDTVFFRPTLALGEIEADQGVNGAVTVTALYFWDFGSGSGGHGVYIDAMAIEGSTFRFIADDFVDVQQTPDRGTNADLTMNANENGFVETEGLGSDHIDITARFAKATSPFPAPSEPLPPWQFVKWIEVLRGINGSIQPPENKTETAPTFTVFQSDIVLRIALYKAIDNRPPARKPVRYYDDWMVFRGLIDGTPGYIVNRKTGEVVPVGPFPPLEFATQLRQRLEAYSLLVNSGLSPDSRALRGVLFAMQSTLADERKLTAPKNRG